MHKFSDGDGRVWEVKLDIPAAKEVWKRTGLNLRSRADLQRLTGDESLWLLPDVLYVLCADQSARRYEHVGLDVGVQSAEFGRMLEPCIGPAATALFSELADFCRRLGLQATASLVEALATRLATQETHEQERLGAKLLPAMAAEIDQALTNREAILDRILGIAAGSSPASLGSCRCAGSPCESSSPPTGVWSSSDGEKSPGSVT